MEPKTKTFSVPPEKSFQLDSHGHLGAQPSPREAHRRVSEDLLGQGLRLRGPARGQAPAPCRESTWEVAVWVWFYFGLDRGRLGLAWVGGCWSGFGLVLVGSGLVLLWFWLVLVGLVENRWRCLVCPVVFFGHLLDTYASEWVPKRPKMEMWAMEPRTKMCGPHGGLSLTHSHIVWEEEPHLKPS